MKTYFKTMARCFAVAFVAVAVSCTKELAPDPNGMGILGEERLLNVDATLPQPTLAGEKAYLDTTNCKVLWESFDQINVNGYALEAYILHNDYVEPRAVFGGNTCANTSAVSGKDVYWAVYPKHLAPLSNSSPLIPHNFASNAQLKFNFPDTQTFNYTGTANSMHGNTYMAAYVEVPNNQTTFTFSMKNLGAIMHLRLSAGSGLTTNQKRINKIEILSDDGALAGKFTVLNDDTTIAPVADSTKNKIKVNLKNGANNYIDISTRQDIYVMLPPLENKKLTVRIYNIDGYYTKLEKSSSRITMKRSKIYHSDITLTSFPEYPQYIVTPGGDTIVFAPGNLQFRATNAGVAGDLTHLTASGTRANGQFRLAPHQWDTIGAGNKNIGPLYSGWIDQFGWGTSGWNNGNVYYMPWDTMYVTGEGSANIGNGYGPTNGSSYEFDITGTYAYSDWGIYNEIYNPSTGQTDPPGTWRTPTKDEWYYMFFSRPFKVGLGNINGINGLVIIPDLWITPSGCSFTGANILGPGILPGMTYNTNQYTIAQWALMEQAGAIFLPAAGYRSRGTMTCVNEYGDYHSSTHEGTYQNYIPFFIYWTGNGSNPAGYYIWNQGGEGIAAGSSWYGRSVRLIRNYVGD